MKTIPLPSETSTALAEITRHALGRYEVAHDVPTSALQFAFEGDDMADVSKLRIRCSNLVSRMAYSSYLNNSSYMEDIRMFLHIRMSIFGYPANFFIPTKRRSEGGFLGNFPSGAPSIEDLVAAIRVSYPNKPLPFPEDGKGCSNIRTSYRRIGGHNDFGLEDWTPYGRVVATLNAWLKSMHFPETITPHIGNELLAKLAAELRNSTPAVSWYEGPISRCYEQNGNAPYPSCMKGRDADWFAMYDHMQDNGQVKLLEVRERGDHIGRALVWFGSNPDDAYIDRIYAPTSETSSDPRVDVIEAIAAFCKAEGIRKTVYPQTSRLIPDLQRVLKLRIDIGRGYDDFEHFPYCDSMTYLSRCGWLSTFGYGNDTVGLQSTEGVHEGNEGIVLANGERVDENDAVWVSRYDEHHHRDDCTYSDYLGEWVLDESSVHTACGAFVWDDCDDLVELRNGDYCLIENTVSMHDETYVYDNDYRVDLVQLHDDTWADRNNDDVVQLYDDMWALRGDAVELHDGTFALDDDDDVVEVDGAHYLSADAPSDDEDDEDDEDTEDVSTPKHTEATA
jgi:hypothetical protein